MRIISGLHKGRRLKAPPGMNTRPTADKVKEALFSVLASFVPEAKVLDAFAGSGALGLEALSRGAAMAVFVEKNASAFATLSENISACGFEKAFPWHGDIFKLLPKIKTKEPELHFDLVFLDPPYGKGQIITALNALTELELLHADSMIVAETGTKEEVPDLPEAFEIWKSAVYGDTSLHYCKLRRA